MRKLTVFNSISLDGYFTGRNGDLSWAHRQSQNDKEFQEFVAGNASGGDSELLFGRVTYEMMIAYWPTPAAKQNDPVVAEGMNRRRKIVFSRTLDEAEWENTRVVKSDPAAEVKRMKSGDGPALVLLGSGTIVSLLTQHNLVDEYQFIVVPVVLGGGRTMFEGVRDELPMRLASSRAFKNGNVFLRYETTAP
jgi:dihydrofolate reductase